MDVLFLKNPKTGEVRRLWSTAIIPAELGVFEGWVAVDWKAWVDANTDMMPVLSAPQLEATAPTAAAQGEVCRCGYPMADHDADGQCPGDGYTGQRSPDQILTPTELVHLWRDMKADPHDIHKQLAYFKSLADARLTDGYKFIDERNALAAERASLEAALQQAQRERDAAVAAIAPFIAIAKSVIDNRHKLPWYNGDNPVAFSMGGVGVTFEDCSRLLSTMAREYGRRAASALQAAQPADGEG